MGTNLIRGYPVSSANSNLNVLFCIAPVKDEVGQLNNYIAVFSDLSVVKQSQEKPVYQANHDPLTDLPNRKVINDRLEHAFECARRDETRVAALFFDVDRFKAINDSLGYKVGDMLLQQIALRLMAQLREEDTAMAINLSGDTRPSSG